MPAETQLREIGMCEQIFIVNYTAFYVLDAGCALGKFVNNASYRIKKN